MGDLISRSALLKKLESMTNDNEEHVRNNSHQFTYKELAYIICNMPTAYDVDKVVAEFEKMRNEDSQGCKDVVGRKCFSYIDCGLCIMDRAIDIVRKGGAE